MTTPPTIHSEACIRAMARQEAYDGRWPRRCQTCHGAGGSSYSFDPSPGGSRAPSLGPGSMEDFDTCSCVDNGQCPRCGEQLIGPKWRPLNVLTALGYRIGRLAVRAQHARPSEVVTRAAYWRCLAAFREDPNPWTWAAYHTVDQLWTRVFEKSGHRPTWLAQRLWDAQNLLERGSSDDRPCWHCGWNWNKSPGDARDPHQCACWIADFEADEAALLAQLEQEEAERRSIEGLGVEVDGISRVAILLTVCSLMGGG